VIDRRQSQFVMFRPFVGGIDSREIDQFAARRLGVQALWVALATDVDRRIRCSSSANRSRAINRSQR
jgi:hypothetical protein